MIEKTPIPDEGISKGSEGKVLCFIFDTVMFMATITVLFFACKLLLELLRRY